MSPTVLLFLDHAAALGGAERSLLLLLRHLDRRRWEPHLACPPGALAQAATAMAVPVHPFDFPRLRRSTTAALDWLGGARALSGLVRTTGARLVVANTVRAAFYGALGARLAGRPFVWHMRDFWLREGRPRHPWADGLGKRFLCHLAASVIANSQATAAHLPSPQRVEVIHNGIEVATFEPGMGGGAFRRRYSIPEAAPLVGMVGRLRPWKGQERFLRIVARVRRARPSLWGVVVGGSPFGVEDGYPQRLRHLAAELGLAERVVFTGQVDDTRPALAAMDLFVHPGDPEPFGLVNVEAMAMGKAVIAFAHGALPEIVVDGETGVLVPPGDEAAMADAIVRLLDAPERRGAMGATGRRRAASHFEIGRTVSAFEALLRSLVG